MKRYLPFTMVLALFASINTLAAQSTVFTYQGRVTDDGTNFNGSGQFQFVLVTSTNANHMATATANAPSGGYITGYIVTFGGNGYVTAPAVTVFGGGGSGAAAHANISGGIVTSITVDNPGNGGYTSAPTVLIAPPPAQISYTTYWSNDGTSVAGSEPSAAVNVTVNNGLLTVVLGDTTIPNMAAIDTSLFSQPNLQLRIWFNDGVSGFAALNPVQNLTPAPYAVNAVFANTASNLASGLSIQQNTDGAPNVIGGASVNFVSSGVEGATIAGGGSSSANLSNSVTAAFGTIGGGVGNTVSGEEGATVGGGERNTASDFATVSGGNNNQATNYFATVPGGENNIAGGQYSFAAGQQAQALHQGAFVWADSQNAPFASTTNDQFLVRAQGGVGINMNNPGGASLYVQGNRNGGQTSSVGYFENTSTFNDAGLGSSPALRVVVDGGSSPDGALSVSANGTGNIAEFGNGNSFVVTIEHDGSILNKGVILTSDRNAKENFTVLDAQTVLAKIAAMPVTEWNYKDDPASQKHIGPVAQDFHAAFGLNGADDKHISVVDEGGVALAAIQGLNQKLQEELNRQNAENAELKRQNDLFAEQLNELKATVKSLAEKK